MRVGVPKEIKNNEFRVGLTPASVAELTAAGHEVVVETNAGLGIDFSDESYVSAGAEILTTASAVFDAADMIVKVKEPQAGEIAMLKPQHLLFTYLHLAADKPQAESSEEHTSELQSLMRISYAVFCLKKKKHRNQKT